MLDLTNFGLDIGVFIVNAMISVIEFLKVTTILIIIIFVKFAGVDPEVLGIDRQRSQSGQRVSTNSFSSFSDFDDNDFASFDEPILVPAIIPARPKPIEKINTNR